MLSSHSSSYDGNDVDGSPGQNLDGVEEIGKIPRTVDLGDDVVFQVPRGLGLPEEDHALRPVRQRVTFGVVLPKSSPGHIRKLRWRLVALRRHCRNHHGPQTR